MRFVLNRLGDGLFMLSLADVQPLERAVALSRRHLALIDRGQRMIKKMLPALDVMRYPQLHAAERERLGALVAAFVLLPPPAATDDAGQVLARQLEQSTQLLTVWTQEFLPRLLRHARPKLRPPLQRLRDETDALLAQTAAVARAILGRQA